jgi:hypothetical protein
MEKVRLLVGHRSHPHEAVPVPGGRDLALGVEGDGTDTPRRARACRGGGAGFGLATTETVGAGRALGRDELGRDLTQEAGVTSSVNLTLAPDPDQAGHLVRPEMAARGERHRANLARILRPAAPGVQTFDPRRGGLELPRESAITPNLAQIL